MNGWQLIQQTAIRWPNMKAILASGYLEDSERCELEKNSTVRVLDKPFHMREAADLVAEMLFHPPAQQPPNILTEQGNAANY